jgi:peptide/nickel transport system permease protein
VLLKVGRALLVVVAVTMATQALLNLTPGGLSATILGTGASPSAIKQLNHQLGLDRPFFVQYWKWATGVLHGDLGRSPLDERRVWDVIKTGLPVTVELVLLASVIALMLAVVLATLAARRPGGVADKIGNVLTSTSLAIPTFVLAPVLIYFFAVETQAFPVTGWTPLSQNPIENLHSAFLPALAIALPEFAVFQRLFQGDLITTLREPYVDAARARGISEPRILFRHAFRPASISLITVAGLSVGRLLGSTIVVESLFALPGIGAELQQAIVAHDLVLVQGFVVFLAVSYVVINLLVDSLYGVIDPRIRSQAQR